MTTIQTGKTLTINGQAYTVEQVETAADKRANGHPRTAGLMEERGIQASIFIRRPAGRVVSQVWQFADGRFSQLTRIG